MSLVKSLVMELRPRLQSVNVYVVLVKADSVSIRLNNDHFELRAASLSQRVACAEFRIVADSLSGFVCAGDQLTFRFGTENPVADLGRLKCELLPMTLDRVPRRSPFVHEGETYCISCTDCSQALSDPIRFESALPLPENGVTSDWFCHSHTTLADLQPKCTQILYGDYFAYLNPTLLQLFNDDSTLYCPECSSWIGTREKGAYKVWFNTANFGGGVDNNGALIDVIAMLQLAYITPFSPVRVALQCHDPRHPTDVILLWIMERNLTVYFDDLKSTVAKVLFRMENKSSDVASEWLSNVNITVYDVSKPMLSKLSEHLYDMNRYIPKGFNVSNDFNVSYILCNKKV